MWFVLIGAGLVAETAVIVALGRAVTARYEAGATQPLVLRHAALDRGAGGRPDGLDGDSAAGPGGPEVSVRSRPPVGEVAGAALT